MKKLCVLIAACTLLPLVCGFTAPPDGNSLFCWNCEIVGIEEEQQALFERMDSLGLTVLYQCFTEENTESQIRDFLREAAAWGIGVYYLAGEPEWGLDPEGEEMLALVSRAAEINEELPEEARLRGVLIDTEPYLTEDWEDHGEEVTACFAGAMAKVRESAAENGLFCALCIPYFYDDMVTLEALSALIQSCDSIAIMNYEKQDEAVQILTELALAGDRPVTVIYELQAPGTHGLEEENTYYYEGLAGVEESFQALDTIFDRENFTYALHHYSVLREWEEQG